MRNIFVKQSVFFPTYYLKPIVSKYRLAIPVKVFYAMSIYRVDIIKYSYYFGTHIVISNFKFTLKLTEIVNCKLKLVTISIWINKQFNCHFT